MHIDNWLQPPDVTCSSPLNVYCGCCFTRRVLCRMSDFMRGIASGMDKTGMFSSPLAAAFWAYHLTRTGFLTVQGFTGTV